MPNDGVGVVVRRLGTHLRCLPACPLRLAYRRKPRGGRPCFRSYVRILRIVYAPFASSNHFKPFRVAQHSLYHILRSMLLVRDKTTDSTSYLIVSNCFTVNTHFDCILLVASLGSWCWCHGSFTWQLPQDATRSPSPSRHDATKLL